MSQDSGHVKHPDAPLGDEDRENGAEHESKLSTEQLSKEKQVTDQPAEQESEPPQVKKKKKSKSKSKSKKKKTLPTGFEDFYVDVPLTAAEHQEEQNIYSQSIPFPYRIEVAVKRYRKRRHFDPQRLHLFDKYLSFGGIECGNKAFQGHGDFEDEGVQAEDIAELTSTGSLAPWVHKHAKVDFNGMMQAFLSCRISQVLEMTDPAQIKVYTNTLHNFLNYLLHHDVCPEYADQIKQAKATCMQAEAELCAIAASTKVFPGAFNQACSTLFGGYYYGLYAGDQPWAQGLDLNVGFDDVTARRIFAVGLAAHGDETMCRAYAGQASEPETISMTPACKSRRPVVSALHVGARQTFLEVVAIERATPETIAFYEEQSVTGQTPLGRLHVRVWKCPATPDFEPMTEAQVAAAKTAQDSDGVDDNDKYDELEDSMPDEYTFWLEDEILQTIFIGLKFEAIVRKTSFGVWYFDTVSTILCSFYNFVPNEDMLGWREHVYLPPRDWIAPPLPRPAEAGWSEPGQPVQSGQSGSLSGVKTTNAANAPFPNGTSQSSGLHHAPIEEDSDSDEEPVMDMDDLLARFKVGPGSGSEDEE